MTVKEPRKLIFSVAVCQAAGFIGSLFTAPAIPTWYAGLNKPSFTPPDVVFAPVWISLYTLMGIALYLVWRKTTRKRRVRTAVNLFFFQLGVNALWSILFFGFREIYIALLEIVFLWALIAILLRRFWEIDKTAGWLLVPYLLWVTIAALLNFSLWILNS